MIKLHLTNSDAPVLLNEKECVFFPTEDNETIVFDTIEDLRNYIDCEYDEVAIIVTESLEEIEKLIKCN